MSGLERAAKALCEKSGETWRTRPDVPAVGLHDYDFDALNNHWRAKARAVILSLIENLNEEVTQEDRALAYALVSAPEDAVQILDGKLDHHPIVRRLAAHRLQSIRSWLGGIAEGDGE